jgi:CheY-like chemotaxis protein
MSRIIVSDTGQGISPDFMPNVFEAFRQGDSSTRREFAGLGLGLSIVKQLVEMHGGTVHAESAGVSKGATFTIELPITAIAKLDETAGDSASTGAGAGETVRLDGLRILAVDDEADARRILTKVLSDAGATVTAMPNVSEALAALDKIHPHLLISDLAMPGEDGYDLIRKVRAMGISAQSLPAMALTAFAHKEYASNALLAGYQFYISKPVDPRHLVVAVASLTGRTG